jgi:cell division GTPase FtsZ
MNELMGIKRKPLITEQNIMSFVKMFIKKGLTFNQSLDDAAELMVTYGKMTRQEVDDAVNLIKNEKSLVNDINSTYINSRFASSLNDDIRISTKIDDLIKKSGTKNLDDFIKNIKLLTQKEVDFITSDVVKNMIKNNEFVNANDTFINVWHPELKKILRDNLSNSKSKLNLSDFESAYEMAAKVWTEGFVSGREYRPRCGYRDKQTLGPIPNPIYLT